MRRRAARDRPRRRDAGRGDHRVAGVLDAAGRSGVRPLARRTRPGPHARLRRPGGRRERDGDTLHIRFNRPQRHNAFSTDARAALLEALAVAQLDPSVTGIVLSGNGPSFCSGGDLAEFGTFADPASAHLARTRHSPALALDALTARLGRACRARGARPGDGQRVGDGGVLRMG